MGFFKFFKDKNKQEDIHQSGSYQIDESQKEFIKDMTSNAERIVDAYNEALAGT